MNGKAKKIVKGAVIALVVLVIAAVVVFWAMFRRELKTLGPIARA